MRSQCIDPYPHPDTTYIDHHLEGLEQRLIDLERKITRQYAKTVHKTNCLAASSTYICDALGMYSQALTNQQSSIDHTKHVVTAQARTIAAQARTIASQQEIIQDMRCNISCLAGWNSELQNRINAHDEEPSRRNEHDEAIRKVWAALREHIELFEYIEKQTYWMNMYSKQMMLFRATELEQIATPNDNAATTAGSVYSDRTTKSTLVGNQPQHQHVLLDRIVVKMIKNHAPDRFQGVCDGFEVVHGISPVAFEEDLMSSRAVTQVE